MLSQISAETRMAHRHLPSSSGYAVLGAAQVAPCVLLGPTVTCPFKQEGGLVAQHDSAVRIGADYLRLSNMRNAHAPVALRPRLLALVPSVRPHGPS